MDDIKITELPDGGCIVETDEETICYTAEEVTEMEQDYINAVYRVLEKGGSTCSKSKSTKRNSVAWSKKS